MTTQASRSCARARRGAVQIWVALMGLVLIGFLGLSIDAAWAAFAGYRLQNAAEAAALAGALVVRDDADAAREAAAELALLNPGAGGDLLELDLNLPNDPGGDIVLGRYNRSTGGFWTGLVPNAVQVRAGQEVDLFFGQVFGVPAVPVTRTAIAMADGGDGAALLVLHPTNAKALDVGGTTTLVVAGGPIQVNSSATVAASLAGTANIVAEEVWTVGGVSGFGGFPPGFVTTGMPPKPDPLAALPEPSASALTNYGSLTINANQEGTALPGYYPNGITIQGTAVLQPGIYVTGSIALGVQSSVTGEGVMIFVTCENQNNNNTSAVNITAGPLVHLTPPDPLVHNFAGANTYEGITVFQKRGTLNPAKFTFAGNTTLAGTWYFPDNAVNIAGSGTNHLARMIASELSFAGSGACTITYTGNQSAGGANVFLVR